jgi:hypothetical protein
VSLDKLQRRMTAFVTWIATEREKEDEIREQADSIRKKIKAKATDDGLTIQSTPNSGSFAKRTGLRRHLRGESVVDGQDVDLPFVVSPKTDEDKKLRSLLPRFERYAKAAYPDTERETTKSSVCLKFSNQLSYDLVPVLATSDPKRQVLIRLNGDRRETSLQNHVEFVRSRTKKSDDHAGRVKFNEVVRLVKWWRYFRQSESSVFDDVPTFLIDLLCAHAFDARGVQGGYAQTFAEWSGYLARVVRHRELVAFSEFGKAPKSLPDGVLWGVFDRVSPDNNIVDSWTALKCDELMGWFADAHDTLCDTIVTHEQGLDAQGLDELVSVFGAPIGSHCGE